MAVDAQRLLAGDLAASLSLYVASEVINASGQLLTTAELVLASLVCAVVTTAASAWLQRASERVQDAQSSLRILIHLLADVCQTVSYLSATVTVQLSLVLIRSSLSLPYSRLLAVLSTLMVTRASLSLSTLAQRPVLPPSAEAKAR